MQRIALAIIVAVAIAGAIAVAATWLRTARGDAATGAGTAGSGRAVAAPRNGALPKLSFVLLAALVLYVGLGGAG